MSRWARPHGLPAGHQVAVLGRGVAPLGRAGERLGLGDQLLLGRAGVVTLGVQGREVRLAVLGEDRPGVREAVPQLVVALAVQARQRLPGVHQGAQPVAGLPPLGGLGELLGLGDQLVLGGAGLVLCLGTGGLALLTAGLDVGTQRVQALGQRVQVTHRVRLHDLGTQVLQGRLGVLGRKVGGPYPLLQQADLHGDALVLALEVGEGLLGKPACQEPTTRSPSAVLT